MLVIVVEWPRLAPLYMSRSPLSCRPLVPVHGDCHPLNVFIPKSGSDPPKFIDWEWAGFGTELGDLAALVKGTHRLIQDETLALHVETSGIDLREARKRFLWCQANVELRNLAFFAAGFGRLHSNWPIVERSWRETLHALGGLAAE